MRDTWKSWLDTWDESLCHSDESPHSCRTKDVIYLFIHLYQNIWGQECPYLKLFVCVCCVCLLLFSINLWPRHNIDLYSIFFFIQMYWIVSENRVSIQRGTAAVSWKLLLKTWQARGCGGNEIMSFCSKYLIGQKEQWKGHWEDIKENWTSCSVSGELMWWKTYWTNNIK